MGINRMGASSWMDPLASAADRWCQSSTWRSFHRMTRSSGDASHCHSSSRKSGFASRSSQLGRFHTCSWRFHTLDGQASKDWWWWCMGKGMGILPSKTFSHWRMGPARVFFLASEFVHWHQVSACQGSRLESQSWSASSDPEKYELYLFWIYYYKPWYICSWFPPPYPRRNLQGSGSSRNSRSCPSVFYVSSRVALRTRHLWWRHLN